MNKSSLLRKVRKLQDGSTLSSETMESLKEIASDIGVTYNRSIVKKELIKLITSRMQEIEGKAQSAYVTRCMKKKDVLTDYKNKGLYPFQKDQRTMCTDLAWLNDGSGVVIDAVFKNDCDRWIVNKTVNPATLRPISPSCAVYERLKEECMPDIDMEAALYPVMNNGTFNNNKSKFVEYFLALFDVRIFDGKLKNKIKYEWCDAENIFAQTVCLNNNVAKILLSNEYIRSINDIRDVLIHQLCHVATFIIDKQASGGTHGPAWNKWKQKCERTFPQLPRIEDDCHTLQTFRFQNQSPQDMFSSSSSLRSPAPLSRNAVQSPIRRLARNVTQRSRSRSPALGGITTTPAHPVSYRRHSTVDRNYNSSTMMRKSSLYDHFDASPALARMSSPNLSRISRYQSSPTRKSPYKQIDNENNTWEELLMVNLTRTYTVPKRKRTDDDRSRIDHSAQTDDNNVNTTFSKPNPTTFNDVGTQSSSYIQPGQAVRMSSPTRSRIPVYRGPRGSSTRTTPSIHLENDDDSLEELSTTTSSPLSSYEAPERITSDIDHNDDNAIERIDQPAAQTESMHDNVVNATSSAVNTPITDPPTYEDVKAQPSAYIQVEQPSPDNQTAEDESDDDDDFQDSFEEPHTDVDAEASVDNETNNDSIDLTVEQTDTKSNESGDEQSENGDGSGRQDQSPENVDATEAEVETRVDTTSEILTAKSSVHYMLTDGDITVASYKYFCEQRDLKPRDTIFVFPGNKSHHKPDVTITTVKSGSGLAKVAKILGEAGYPTFSLPTQDADFKNDGSNKTIAEEAIEYLYKVIREYYMNVIIPVRLHLNDTYFSQFIPFANVFVEPRFWDGSEKTPNLPIANFYLDNILYMDYVSWLRSVYEIDEGH